MNFSDSTCANFTNDNQSCVDAYPHRNFGVSAVSQFSRQLLRFLHDVQSGENCSLRVVVMGDRISEVGQHSIAGILVDVATVSISTLDANLLVDAQQLSEIFGIEASRQGRCTNDIGEQHRELATLPVWGACREAAASKRSFGQDRLAAASTEAS
jgi:hypothetical protein